MIAIDAKNLSKSFRLYKSPSQRLKEIVLRKPFHTIFAALDNITFSIGEGETFGIIGENGAGKSTLLKILARTLKPTSGNLTINGRTAALLELGAGFNPDLTGEDNIFLNAYLMGLSKKEIEGKIEEIITFSELGDFIKRPVKTYSSGMYVRLAFSIATSVNPDILIIDEALSVGDQYFQKKCIDRMMQIKNQGKTILFCSHSLYLIQELCHRTVWLKNGRIAKIGETSAVIKSYNDWIRQKKSEIRLPSSTKQDITGDTKNILAIKEILLLDNKDNELTSAKTGDDLLMKILIHSPECSTPYKGHIGVALNRNDNECIFAVSTKMDGLPLIEFENGKEIYVKFPSLPLLAGQYYFSITVLDEYSIHPFDIKLSKVFSIDNSHEELGIIKLAHRWQIKTPEHFN